jgi:ribonucleoside-diphosphate reductase beta chain
MLRSRTVFASYEHFLDIAASVQWDERAISLRADARAWPSVADARLTELVAGFCVGEAGVAEHLSVFASGPAAACFEAQTLDEERHARFFARYAAAVGLGDPREHVSPAFLELFEVRLPEAVSGAPGPAVGLYHMVLEGVVFTAGQLALLDLLEDDRLPGLKRGTELVLRDERWHVGFGARCLADLSYDEAAILSQGEQAAALWAPEYAGRVMDGLRSRLRAVRRQAAQLGDRSRQPADAGAVRDRFGHRFADAP